VLVTTDEIPNPNALRIRTVLNGEVMQDWNTNDMIFDVPTRSSSSQRQQDAAARHRDPHRHAARRRLRAQSARLAQGRRHA
jgi:hypothetical protein